MTVIMNCVAVQLAVVDAYTSPAGGEHRRPRVWAVLLPVIVLALIVALPSSTDTAPPQSLASLPVKSEVSMSVMMTQ